VVEADEVFKGGYFAHYHTSSQAVRSLWTGRCPESGLALEKSVLVEIEAELSCSITSRYLFATGCGRIAGILSTVCRECSLVRGEEMVERRASTTWLAAVTAE
jgi:hypothetical protein